MDAGAYPKPVATWLFERKMVHQDAPYLTSFKHMLDDAVVVARVAEARENAPHR